MANNGGSNRNYAKIINALLEISDEDNPVSINMIHKQICDSGFKKIDKKTIARALRDLQNKDSCFLGLQVYINNIDDKGKGFDFKSEKYYIDSFFEAEEAAFLRDAIAVYPYMGKVPNSKKTQTEILIDKINKLVPKHNRKEYVDYHISAVKNDINIIKPIGHIQKAIKDKKKVSFKYYQYNHNKKLEQRGGERVVSPITLLWANGYYYLVAYSEKYKHNVNYRVDRMKGVSYVENEDADLNNIKLDILEYENQHPIMFGDDPERITIKCKKYIINNVIDSFGIDVHMLECKDDKDFVEFSTSASYGGAKLWALQYIQDCEVIKPEKMRTEIKNILQQGASKY